MMKKLFILWMVPILALSLMGLAWAQEKAKSEEPSALSKPAFEKSTEVANPGKTMTQEKAGEQRVSAEPAIRRMGGLVTAVDSQSHTISIHQETVNHDWVMQLKVNRDASKELSNIKAGDLVNIWFNGKVVTAVNKVG